MLIFECPGIWRDDFQIGWVVLKVKEQGKYCTYAGSATPAYVHNISSFVPFRIALAPKSGYFHSESQRANRSRLRVAPPTSTTIAALPVTPGVAATPGTCANDRLISIRAEVLRLVGLPSLGIQRGYEAA
jgi:hypothetical protein